ncbi:hypothetical protein RJ639_008924 [Escallonia herrerae]|uniref:SWI/SNF complex subunit SWI3B n=1 Tax=Escallonia herrerae TaxID=1293975 RepID=A0AA88VS13_9ASTE|nr:hypothetical protein RJ639_008924 [Escallonia herrerae]
MATSISTSKSPVKQQVLPKPAAAATTTATTPNKLESSPNPTTPTPVSATPTTGSKKSTTPTEQPTPSVESQLIHIPSYSRWFSWNDVDDCESRFLPEFFDGRLGSKNPRVYKYYRNSIIRSFRENPGRRISFTEARKSIIGDVGSVRRVFDFLEAWGLINYFGPKTQLKWDDKDGKSSAVAAYGSNDSAGISADVTVKKRTCSNCNLPCSIACFVSDKNGSTLCSRCLISGTKSGFRRVEISEEEIKTDWTDKETLHLLEAIMHYGDDWKKVALHVGGRSETECVARFIKLPFGEQFVGPTDPAEAVENFYQTENQSSAGFSPAKRLRLTPLADSSNPIMAQAAFLSALVGTDVAEAAACAAVRALSEGNSGAIQLESSSTSDGTKSLERACTDARLQLEKEEQDLERAISDIAEVQTKEIRDKIVHFEELELETEREWQQLQKMQNLLFVDQLTLLFHKTAAPKSGEGVEENIKAE